MSIKKFVGLAAVVAAFAITATAFAATWSFGSATLRLGSMGSNVQTLQTALNVDNNAQLTVDGDFGHGTLAAVEAFQASKGLTADGVVGPMTMAALNNAGSMMTTGSSTASCPAGYTCTSTAPATTVTCPAGYTCVSTSTGTSTTSGTGPFSINSVQPLSGYYNTQVGVGSVNKVVGDLRIVSGAGGAGTLNGINLSFYNRGNGNYQFPVYASSVSVLLNGTVVGSLPATSFTQYNSQYSAYIPLSGAMLNPSSTNDLQIAISALPVIDSANLGTANQFAFEVTALRYADSTGSFQYSIPSGENFDNGNLTSGTLQSSIQFATASTANSITLTITKDQADYNNHVVAAQTSSQTQNQSLAILDLQAQGSAVTINRLPVTVTVANTGTGGVNVSALLNTLSIYKGTSVSGTPVDSEATNGSQATGTACTTNSNASVCVITFQNLNLTIPAGTTQQLTIAGNVNAIDGTVVAAGASAQVSVTSSNVYNTSSLPDIQAYDQNDNVLNNVSQNVLIGSTTGSVVSFYVNGIQVNALGTTGVQGGAYATASNPGGTQSHSTLGFTIPFSVTAFGQPAYIHDTATAATGASTSTSTQFCVDNASGTCQAVGTGVISYAGSNGLTPDGNGNYLISAGQTQNFTLQITYTANGAASYRASLLNVPFNNTDSNSTYTSYTAGLDQGNFQTNYVSAS